MSDVNKILSMRNDIAFAGNHSCLLFIIPSKLTEVGDKGLSAGYYNF
jgi:hypothetical protein